MSVDGIKSRVVASEMVEMSGDWWCWRHWGWTVLLATAVTCIDNSMSDRCDSSPSNTRSPAIAEGPRDALCQSEYISQQSVKIDFIINVYLNTIPIRVIIIIIIRTSKLPQNTNETVSVSQISMKIHPQLMGLFCFCIFKNYTENIITSAKFVAMTTLR